MALDTMFNFAYTNNYTEFAYIDGAIDVISVYETATKTTPLFTKALSYTDGSITSLTITDEDTGYVLTKTLTYDVNSNITSTAISVA